MAKKIKNLINKRFNRWLVLDCAGKDKNGKILWLCECSCENKTQRILTGNCLTQEKSKSCGCLHKENINKRTKDITNMKFGKLTAIKKISNIKNIWLFNCECNNTIEIHAKRVVNKKGIRSCGKCPNNQYEFFDNFVMIFDSNNNFFYIDIEDYIMIKNYTWFISNNYVTTHLDNKTIWLHRFIMHPKDCEVVDHKNGNSLDNRKFNLRICTQQENTINRKRMKNNKSGIAGVRWHNTYNSWYAYITVNHKQKHLGSFDNLKDAVLARLDAELKYFGEYRNNRNDEYIQYILNKEKAFSKE